MEGSNKEKSEKKEKSRIWKKEKKGRIKKKETEAT